MGRVSLSFSGIVVELGGVSSALADEIDERWPGFAVTDPARPYLRLEVSYSAERTRLGDFNPNAMRAEMTGERAVFRMPEGSAELGADGTARVRLRKALGRREFWTLTNLLRACLAWHLPRRNAALIHAAGLEVEGRAFLLVGPQGSGKSSWAALGEQAGARVLSDDLVLVDAAGPTPAVLGAPFRSTHVAEYRPGRWPLAAILFPRREPTPSWSPASTLLARARLVANLPFICDAPEQDARWAALAERLATSVPCRDFGFALDTSFMELLRSAP